MSRYPNMAGPSQSNTYDVHKYIGRMVFGSSDLTLASSYMKDCTVARNSAGNYTITLPKTYSNLIDFRGSFTKDASGAILFWVGVTDTIATDGKLIIEARTEAGTATDPTSGDTATWVLEVSDSPLNTKFALG